jgi:hypothetical protein
MGHADWVELQKESIEQASFQVCASRHVMFSATGCGSRVRE